MPRDSSPRPAKARRVKKHYGRKQTLTARAFPAPGLAEAGTPPEGGVNKITQETEMYFAERQ